MKDKSKGGLENGYFEYHPNFADFCRDLSFSAITKECGADLTVNADDYNEVAAFYNNMLDIINKTEPSDNPLSLVISHFPAAYSLTVIDPRHIERQPVRGENYTHGYDFTDYSRFLFSPILIKNKETGEALDTPAKVFKSIMTSLVYYDVVERVSKMPFNND